MAVGRLGVAWKLQDRLVSVTNALVAAALDARTKVTYSWKSQSTARRRLKKSLGLCGDMNIRPHELTTWSDIRALGYHETFELYEQREGKQLPCTCKGATRNDTLVFSRHFAASFSQAFVSQSKSVTQKTATSSSRSLLSLRWFIFDVSSRSAPSPGARHVNWESCDVPTGARGLVVAIAPRFVEPPAISTSLPLMIRICNFVIVHTGIFITDKSSSNH